MGLRIRKCSSSPEARGKKYRCLQSQLYHRKFSWALAMFKNIEIIIPRLLKRHEMNFNSCVACLKKFLLQTARRMTIYNYREKILERCLNLMKLMPRASTCISVLFEDEFPITIRDWMLVYSISILNWWAVMKLTRKGFGSAVIETRRAFRDSI